MTESRNYPAPKNMRRLRNRLLALALIFPALYVGLALIFMVHDYRAIIGEAGADARSMAAALNNNVTHVIDESDGALVGAIDDVTRAQLNADGRDTAALHAILQSYGKRLPQAININVINAKGLLIASSAGYPMQAIDVSDREYFQEQRAHGDGSLMVGTPFTGRINTNKWLFPLSRRLNNADGTLKMIFEIGINLDYFGHFYDSLQVAHGERLWLLRRDGAVLMENPKPPDLRKLSVAGSEWFRQTQLAKSGNTEELHAVHDDLAGVIGYANANSYPLVSVASFDSRDILVSWRERVGQTALIGAVTIGLMLMLVAVLWKYLRAVHAMQANLERKNASLLSAETRFQGLVNGIDGVVWEAELPTLRFTYVSANAASVTGHAAQEWIADPQFWQRVLSVSGSAEQDAQRMMRSAGDGTSEAGLQPIEHHIVAADGREIWLRSNVALSVETDGTPRLRGVMVDVTAQKVSEQRLFQLAHYDSLTNLPNRQTFSERIRHAIAIAARRRSSLAVVFVDIDHFKTINDSLGHEAGDRVLRMVAERFAAVLRQSDTVARIGGDEFVILLEQGSEAADSFELVAAKLAKSVAEPVSINGYDLFVELSMGICVFPQDGEDSETLLRNADTAMYKAKSSGRNCWRFFDESMARSVARKLELESALRRAVERGELALMYQPQVALDSGKIIGVEALLRWNRPNLGMVPPLEFIPLAEESGLIVSIGNWVLETACAQAAKWLRENGLHLRMAVNISARQIYHKEFVQQVARTLTSTGLPAELLELEITESSILENLEETVRKLQQLKMMGMTIAIDDFGTGYSSLSYLKQLPIDRLKIDRTFVKDIPEDRDDCAIVRTIVAMAKNLGLSAIAEGVETREQVDFLREGGCNEIQGYLISIPLAAHNLESMFNERLDL
ncbi:MAG TPA: EAL domain-containing protein [Burkholderiaceae bacterium]|jgi:diguanylate cyclase (GGDEF)-like protein